MIYNEVILDYFNRDRNVGELPGATHIVKAESAGDVVLLQFIIEDEKITTCHYQVKGSTVLIACCALLAETVIGETLTSAKQLTTEFFIEKFDLTQQHASQVLLVLDALEKL